MNKILLTLCIVFYCSTAHAGDFACGVGANISKRLSCGKVCSINPNCIRIDRKVNLENKKIDDGKLVDLTQVEIDTIAQDRVDAQAQAKLDRLKAFDDALTDTDITGVKLQRIENYIDNIRSYDELKKVLKSIVRYIATAQSSN